MNAEGLALTKTFEGCKLSSYKCPAGVWTIGHGHTKGVYDGQVITQKQANDFLLDDLREAISAVHSMVKTPLNENEESALTDFVFNIGTGAFQKSTLLRLLNEGQHEKAAEEFGKWTRAGGMVLRGLVRRRLAEKLLFEKGVDHGHNGYWERFRLWIKAN